MLETRTCLKNQFKNEASYNCLEPTLVTRIVEVLQIAAIGGKFFRVMVPFEDIVEFMNTNMVLIRALVCRS